MFSTVVLPLDEATQGHRSLTVATSAIQAIDNSIPVEAIHTIPRLLAPHAPTAGAALRAALDAQDIDASIDVLAGDDADALIARWVASRPQPLVIMATTSGGTGRDVVLGSTAEHVVHLLGSPILLVGPHAGAGPALGGQPVIMAVGDDEPTADAIALVRNWARQMNAPVWVVTVTPSSTTGDTVAPPALGRVAEAVGDDTQWEVLHGTDAGAAIADFADRVDAGSIIATTHGRVGVQRLVTGSTTFAVAHRAPCPVLVHQPFEIVHHVDRRERSSSSS